MTAETNTCPLCCEDKAKDEVCWLSNCMHSSCRDCMVKWVENTETTGQTTTPFCPFCRVQLHEEEIEAILGRPFQPSRTASINGIAAEAELDELTLQWLQEQTIQCPGCGARIQKIDDGGCDKMECLCGYRFCYSCGMEGATCSCSPQGHVFYDNITGRGTREGSEADIAPVDEATGRIDLLKHIRKRKHEEEGRQKRTERGYRRDHALWEIQDMDYITYSARWLFACQSNQACMEKLAQDVLINPYW